MTEHFGRLLRMKSVGSGMIRLVWKSSPPKGGAFRSGNVTPVSGSFTPARGWATALPALSCQTAKWFTSVPPMLTTIRSTSRLVTFRLIVV